MREEFEAFAVEKGWDISHNGQHYDYVYAYYAWIGWQAAIDSVVVDVESLPAASYTDDGVVYRSHVEDALEKAGIKYK